MTLEGQDPGAEETPAPPASTRWSEASAEDDDVLLPPYVPGAARDRPEERDTPAPAGGFDAPELEPDEQLADADAGTGEEPWPREDDGGFSEPWGGGDADPWGEPETAVPHSAPPPDPESTTGPGAAGGFPWDAGVSPGFPEMVEGPAEMEEAGSEDFGGHDLGGREEEGLAAAAEEVESGEGSDEGGTGGGLPGLPEPLPEADPQIPAERLEMLADILRREGPSGIQREVASRDRLTSLLAGVVAGYLAGLEG